MASVALNNSCSDGLVIRGRPKSVEKNVAILDAAIQLFLGNGFDGTSMDEIARKAGVSKQTVYAHFSSKEQLFSAAIKSKIEEHDPSAVLAAMSSHTLESDLRIVCEMIFELLVGEDSIRVFRLLCSAAPQGSSLAQLFWESGPDYMLQNIRAFLEGWVEEGELEIEDVDRAAKQLVSLLKGALHFRAAIGLIENVSKAQADKHINDSIDAFLKIYRVKV